MGRKTAMTNDHRDEQVISYYRVRQTLGYLGFVLPVLLILGGLLSLGAVEPSISDYYHTILRDVFVGVICAIGVFLIAYPGHQAETGQLLSDDRMTSLAGVAALGVAFFPNEQRLQGANLGGASLQSGSLQSASLESPLQLLLGHQAAAIGHYLSALIFLTLLGVMCLRRFAKSAKPGRRRIYQTCGWTILVMTFCVLVASWFKVRGPAGPQGFVNGYLLVLWFEAIAVWAFSVAWLTKGRADLALARLLPKGRGQSRDQIGPDQNA